MLKNVVLGLSLVASSASILFAQEHSPLPLQRTIPLAGVTGKFDHFAIDLAGHRLFAAATGSKTVEVIDLNTGKVVESIAGLGKPHGLAWIKETKRLYVADGERGELAIFAGSPLKRIKAIQLSDDADDMAYDDAMHLLYVGHGGSNAANPAQVAVIDTEANTLVANVPVAAHPEALEYDAVHERVFVNISDTGEVVVLDARNHAIVGHWKLKAAKGNTPLAYDAVHNHLLVGCRTPAKLIALDGGTGVEIASAPSDTGADDLFYDSLNQHAFLITGSGTVDTYTVAADGKLTSLGSTKTISGAKTGLLVDEQQVLYIGVPGANTSSEIRAYDANPK